MTAPLNGAAPTVTYQQPGEAIDYTNPSSSVQVSAGDVVVDGFLVKVARSDIAALRQGSLTLGPAVFVFPKATTVGSGQSAGVEMYWDATNKVATPDPALGANKRIGPLVVASLDADATCQIKLGGAGSGSGSRLLYADVAASTAVANTTTETEFDKNVSIPANTLQAGDVLRVRGQGIATATHSTDTLTAKLYVGGLTGTLVASTGALDVANNDIFWFDAEIVVRDVGATGHIVAAGTVNIGTPGTATVKAFNLGSTAIDTTAAQKISVSATWSVADAGNSCRLDILDVELRRK